MLEDSDPFTPNKCKSQGHYPTVYAHDLFLGQEYPKFHKFSCTPSSLSSSSRNHSANTSSVTTSSCSADAIQQMRCKLPILQMRCLLCDMHGHPNTDDHTSGLQCYAVESFRHWRREVGQGISRSCSMCGIAEVSSSPFDNLLETYSL